MNFASISLSFNETFQILLKIQFFLELMFDSWKDNGAHVEMGTIKEWNMGSTFCGKGSLVATGVFVIATRVFVISNWNICQ